MSAVIGTTLPFERLAATLDGKPFDLFGEATIIGDRTSWRIDAITCFGAYGAVPVRMKSGTEAFETVRVALHRQCGEAISARLNGFVEERGGYAILYGVEIPADRFRRGLDRHRPENTRTFWLDAA